VVVLLAAPSQAMAAWYDVHHDRLDELGAVAGVLHVVLDRLCTTKGVAAGAVCT
jgi:hypothetical protein